MLKKILLDQERILVHDTLSYMAGPLKIQSQIILTNHRILVLPHKEWTQNLGYQRQNIIWSNVKEVTLGKLGKNIQIDTSLRTLSLWGTGARRMFEWIKQWRTSGLSLKTNWALLERRQVVLTAEVLISVGAGLAVMGELTINRKGFNLYYQTLATNTEVFTWSALTEPSYSAMSQKFKFTVEGRKFVLQGNQAHLLNHLMDVFSKQDVFVDCLWEAQWEDDHSKNSKPSNGFMMLGHRALYLFPCGLQSSISNQPYIRIPCSKIQHIEREGGMIKLYTSKNKVWSISLSVPDLWMGYMDRLLLHYWNSHHETDHENGFFCTQIHNDKEAVTIGQLHMDQNNIIFQPNGLRPAREIPVYEVVKIHKRSSRLSIQQDVQPEGFELLDDNQVTLMAEQIEPKLSPMSLSFIGKIEPTETILGRVKEMSIFMDGSLLVSIQNSTIIQEEEKLIILCHPVAERIFIPQNVRVEVDIVSKDGHYIFNGLVLQNNLNRPDIDGRHSLTTELLGHVRLINKRAAFRVPTNKAIKFELQHCDFELKHNQAHLIDLSIGGCQLIYQHDLYGVDFSPLKDEAVIVVVYMELEEPKRRTRGKFIQAERKKPKIESVPFPAKIRRIFQPEDERSVIMGIEFLENVPSAEHRLMRKILNLERILMQEHRRSLSDDGFE